MEMNPHQFADDVNQGNQFYLNSQTSRESNARSYPRRLPLAIKKAYGIIVEDMEGKQYYDCLACAGTLALGHNHPVVIEAIQDFIASGYPMQTLDITTPVKEAFVDEVFTSLPAEFAKRAKIQFCSPSGTDAVEAALKLVKTATGRGTMLSFHGAYHGMSQGSLALMGSLGPKTAIQGLMNNVQFIPFPYSYRCPFGLGGELGAEVNSRYIHTVLNDPESGIVSPAGMIVEAVQGEGGVIPAPKEWLKEIRRLTQERSVPLIMDEVQSGIGRTGKMFAFEHADIIPDVIVMSKAIGGGLPLSIIVYDESLDQWRPGAHAGTFRGNQMAMATGLATLKFIKQHQLDEAAAIKGEQLFRKLEHIQAETHCIGEVRGRGLMIGVEIVNMNEAPDAIGSYPAFTELAQTIQRECFSRGLIVELGGRHGNVVRFLPPLIVTEEDIEHICDIFYRAVRVSERSIEYRV